MRTVIWLSIVLLSFTIMDGAIQEKFIYIIFGTLCVIGDIFDIIQKEILLDEIKKLNKYWENKNEF